MSQSLSQIFIHAIFATKNRINIIPTHLEDELYAYIGGIIRNRKSQLIKINGTGNHIHLVFRLHSDKALSHIIRDIKSNSSSWMRRKDPYFSWQSGYGAFSCSYSQLPTLINYVEHQKEHHNTTTFSEEITSLASKWGFEWVWDETTGEQKWVEKLGKTALRANHNGD